MEFNVNNNDEQESDIDRKIQQAELDILNGKENNNEEEGNNEEEKNNNVKSDVQQQRKVVDINSPEYIEKRKLIIHLQRYKDSKLGKYLTAFKLELNQLEPLEIPQLEALLQDVQLTIALRSSNSFNKEVFFTGITLIEAPVSKVTPLNINGMNNLMRQDPEIDDILEEISLQSNKYIRPELRLCLCMVKAAVITDKINKRKTEIEVISRKPVPESKVEKYKDL